MIMRTSTFLLMMLWASLEAVEIPLYIQPDASTPPVSVFDLAEEENFEPKLVFDQKLSAKGWRWIEMPAVLSGYVQPEHLRPDGSVATGTPVHLRAESDSHVFTFITSEDKAEIVESGEWVEIRFTKPVPLYFLDPERVPEQTVPDVVMPKASAGVVQVNAPEPKSEVVAEIGWREQWLDFSKKPQPSVEESLPETTVDVAVEVPVEVVEPVSEPAREPVVEPSVPSVSQMEAPVVETLQEEVVAVEALSEDDVASMENVEEVAVDPVDEVLVETPQEAVLAEVETTPQPKPVKQGGKLKALEKYDEEEKQAHMPAVDALETAQPEAVVPVLEPVVAEEVEVSIVEVPTDQEPIKEAKAQSVQPRPVVPQPSNRPVLVRNSETLPSYLQGTLLRARSGLFRKNPYSFVLHSAAGEKIAYVDVQQAVISGGGHLGQIIGRRVVVQGTTERREGTPPLVIHARAIHIR